MKTLRHIQNQRNPTQTVRNNSNLWNKDIFEHTHKNNKDIV